MLYSQSTSAVLYNGARKWLTLVSFFTVPVLFIINAPFGRFAPSKNSIFLVDGLKSWIVMELVSPLLFLYTYTTSPLTSYTPPTPSWSSPQSLLAALFLIHYTNRAILSPLRAPCRSKSHIAVPLSGVAFNILNGSLMGAYLSSPVARIYLTPANTYNHPLFYVGLALWALGLAGNVLHDEVLYNIRRKAKSKGKAKATDSDGDTTPSKSRTLEHYAIPQGWLYTYVSYPNYLCEWIEWFGFALASAPFPLTSSSFSLLSFASVFSINTLTEPGYMFFPQLTPPYIFFLSEVLLMLPRAWRGHQWYRSRFGEEYPRERKAVIPWLL